MLTILLVEDDPLLAELMGLSVTFANYKLLSAVTAEEALPIITEKNPDLMLLDIMLPGMSGLELLAQVKNNPALKKIPVIILSNLNDEEHIAEGKKLGAAAYLNKANIRPWEVITKVNEVLGTQAQARGV